MPGKTEEWRDGEVFSDGALLKSLERVYTKKHLESEFAREREILKTLVPRVRKALDDSGLVLQPAFNLGSTATIWHAWDRGLRRHRTLKLARPKYTKISEVVAVVREESKRLADLSHQNLTRVYLVEEVALKAYSFPYFVMDYLDGVRDFDEYIMENVPRGLRGEELLQLFRDTLLGINHLHENGIVHCDIKPGNLLVAHGTPALVADLGYSKKIFPRVGEAAELTDVTTTPQYAHPELKARLKSLSDPNASKAEIPRDQLKYTFDLYSFGRTVAKVLEAITEVERRAPTMDPALTPYQRQYMSVIARRLLDGQVETQQDTVFGFPAKAMAELSYRTAGEALDDVEKLLDLYDLEGVLPEVNPNTSRYIQIPHSRVPFTPRVKAVLDHPHFARLGQATQLGFVSLVYPGGRHSRLEHVLGVFAGCCEYVRALWYDDANCFFRSIMDEEHLRLGILAALLHDVGQYPMAHDLGEVTSAFAHEAFTRMVMEAAPSGGGRSLAGIVFEEWGGVDYERILRILTPGADATVRERILHSLISGPLDCDKLDYLRRDATHLGVSFGLSIDYERLRRHLTVVCRTEEVSESDGTAPQIRVVAQVGVVGKALAVALAVRRARRDLFQQVYWQHTVRALKAMLGWATRRVLEKCREGGREGEFWLTFTDWVLRYRSDPQQLVAATNSDPEGTGDLLAEPEDHDPWALPTGLSQSDDSVLRMLARFSDPPASRMLQRMRRRDIYRRTCVISADRKPNEFKALYERFRGYRLDENHEGMEHARQVWELAILEEAGRKDPALIDLHAKLVTDPEHDPVLLVDVPIKALSRVDDPHSLWFLPEDTSGIHSRVGALPSFTASRAPVDDSTFDREVGKIRVFVHPDHADRLARSIDMARVSDIITA